MECKSAWRLNALESAVCFTTVQGTQVVSHRGICCCSPVVQCPKNHHNNHFWKIPKKKRWHLFAILIFLSRFGEMPWCFWSKLVRVECCCKVGDCINRFVIFDFHTVFSMFFPTCQVRVVSFYVSLFSSSSRTPSPPSPPPSSSSSCRDPVSSVWHAGPQPRSCEFSVACRTSTAIL